MFIRKFYYHLKPLIPRRVQISLRRRVIRRQMKFVKHIWPIDPHSVKTPPQWAGWPGGKKIAFVLTHDVELQEGHDKCRQLMNLEKSLGFRSSFNFVPERYRVSKELRDLLTENGFEVGVHGLNHDGKLYQSREEFARRAKKINGYIREWQAAGFRSPAMHHNLDWLRDLNITYDASTFDTDPFEPQSDGTGTIFPFLVPGDGERSGYVELPYTLPQDFTLFILMQETSPETWKRKLDWIAEKGGMALLNVHPDYMNFRGGKPGLQEFPAKIYADFLTYVKTTYTELYWHALPKEVARFWVEKDKMPVFKDKNLNEISYGKYFDHQRQRI